jgi:hypothetical protein
MGSNYLNFGIRKKQKYHAIEILSTNEILETMQHEMKDLKLPAKLGHVKCVCVCVCLFLLGRSKSKIMEHSPISHAFPTLCWLSSHIAVCKRSQRQSSPVTEMKKI